MSEPTATTAERDADADARAAKRLALMTPEARDRHLAQQRANQLVQAIKGATWTKEVTDPRAIQAIAEYCDRHGIDPVTEVNVLGGNLYRNAKYALRKLGELTQAGVVARYGPIDWIHHDKRLDEMGKAGDVRARDEILRRLWARIDHNVPDVATSAGVFRIWLVDVETPAIGVKYFPVGTKGDPVGAAYPMETIETRAIRRAMEFAAGMHAAFAQAAKEMSDDGIKVSAIVQEAREEERRQAALTPSTTNRKQLAGAPTSFEYDPSQPRAEPVRVVGNVGDLAGKQYEAAEAKPEPTPEPKPEPTPEAKSALDPIVVEPHFYEWTDLQLRMCIEDTQAPGAWRDEARNVLAEREAAKADAERK